MRPTPADIWILKVMEYGQIDEHSIVLDVGCGTGRFPLSISALRNPTVVGLELSIEMLREAVDKNRSRDISWILGDGQRLPFRDEAFSCVYMTLVLHRIENKTMELREIHRTLKKGGKCAMMTNAHARLKKSILHYSPRVIALDLKRFPTLPEIKGTMKELGFKGIRHHAVNHDEYMLKDQFLETVRSKYVSTLTLLDDEAFQKGFRIFEGKMLSKEGSLVNRHSGFDFVVGEK